MVQRLRVVYLDWNATTPLAPEVADAMRTAIGVSMGNPASVHGAGRRARRFVEDARAAVSELAGVDPRDVVLTSGGTEANNLALTSAFDESGGTLVVGTIEHPSITRTAAALEARGVRVAWVEPTPEGALPVERFREAIERSERVRLVSLQAVNHETGVVQAVGEVADLARRAGALFHCDAVQAAGRLAPELFRGADLLSIASHKLRGPKGIGALATLCGVKLRPLLTGGEQERGVRPGTQDPIACAGFAAAVAHAAAGPSRYEAVRSLRDELEGGLLSLGRPGHRVERNGGGDRAPHVTNLSFEGWLGPELAAALDLEGVCVSSGSACSAGTADPSPVLTAMLGSERARNAIRISLGEDTSRLDVVEALSVFNRILARTS